MEDIKEYPNWAQNIKAQFDMQKMELKKNARPIRSRTNT